MQQVLKAWKTRNKYDTKLLPMNRYEPKTKKSWKLWYTTFLLFYHATLIAQQCLLLVHRSQKYRSLVRWYKEKCNNNSLALCLAMKEKHYPLLKYPPVLDFITNKTSRMIYVYCKNLFLVVSLFKTKIYHTIQGKGMMQTSAITLFIL